MVASWQEILKAAKTIAVIGLSAKLHRASHGVAAYMQSAGYHILPVNPALEDPVLGESPFRSLADLPQSVDVIDVFRNENELPGLVKEIVALPWRPRLVWFQLGLEPSTQDREALESLGIAVVANRCLMVDHARHLGV